MPRRAGFTLIELLIVIVIIGLLATVALPYLWQARDRGLLSSAMQDLKVFATHQEIYFDKNLTYADEPALITEFQASTGVTITVNYAETDGWAAIAEHVSLASQQCGLFIGNATASDAPPATERGVVACN